jgi:mevalonate kinase
MVEQSQNDFRAKVPGSLMIMGEHAVLYDKPALVAAINRYMKVNLKPRQDRIIQIISNLGVLECSLDTINTIILNEPFQFVLTAILHSHAQSNLPSGFNLTIESEFSEKIGFGSSAAVVVGTVKVLKDFSGKAYSAMQLFQDAKTIIQKVQGIGSGADVAASVMGGLLYYHPKGKKYIQKQNVEQDIEQEIEQDIVIETLNSIQNTFPCIQAIYSGNKIPTPIVIGTVKQNREIHPSIYDNLFEAIAICTHQAKEALLKKNWNHFGQLMNIHHGMQSALGLSNTTLESLVYRLRQIPGIVGAKISGAGLGDCVIGVGDIKDPIEHSIEHATEHSDIISLKLAEGVMEVQSVG